MTECETELGSSETDTMNDVSGNSRKPALSARDREAAEAFGTAPDLIERIVEDFDRCGLVGETANKLLCYVAAVSRKTSRPLSVLILSSSGAGKSALQDATLRFCPPEDVVKLTTLTGKALFYKGENRLRHRILALEEGAGAEDATYAIRNLISARELICETTIRDASSGRLTTMENRVFGPTAVFYTVTNPQTDPETRSRFFVLGVDESRAQTERILANQRRRQTMEGRLMEMRTNSVIDLHRNFQRSLKPVEVVNPFSDQLRYGDGRLQARRDQPKYLELIRAIAFLRQMRKEIRRLRVDGTCIDYVEVDRKDVVIANQLAAEIFGAALDELSVPARYLLKVLRDLTHERVSTSPDETAEMTDMRFTRREVRDFSGWSNHRVHVHLKELVVLEYLVVESGRNGVAYRYRLTGDARDANDPRSLLLTDPDDLVDPVSS